MYLNGERMISSVYVLIPKYDTPILAEAKKKIDTDIIERNTKVQVIGLKSFTRFQIGEVFVGN